MGNVPFIPRSVRGTFFTISVPLFIASVSLLFLAHFRHGAFTYKTQADMDLPLTVCLINSVVFSLLPCLVADMIARSRTGFKLAWTGKAPIIFACVSFGLTHVYILLVKFGFQTIMGVPVDDTARYMTRFLFLPIIIFSAAAIALQTIRKRRSQARPNQTEKHV